MAPDPATWLAGVASRIAASLATKVLGVSARRVQKAFATPEKKAALAQCLAAGLGALIEHGYTGDADADRDHLEHVLTTFAAEEDAQDALEELLAAILASGAAPPDPAPLREVFGKLYDPESLTDFDPDRAFTAFVEAFAAQARQEQALQETIRTERLDELVKLAKHQVKAIEDLPGRIVEEQEKAKLRRGQATREAARRRYLEHMRRRWRALPLAALGGTEGAGEEVTLDQVFIELDTLSPRVIRLSELHQARPKAKIVTALEVVEENPHLALLGDPGAGKSAFTQELLARIASAQLGEEVRLPEGLSLNVLPVFLRLRDVTRLLGEMDLDPMDQESRWQACAHVVRNGLVESLHAEELDDCTDVVRAAWKAGKCFLVLDGLDEVPEKRRALVREAVTAVRQQTRMARILVTCRVRSYQGEAQLPGFEAHTLAPFDEEKIENFCNAWYRAQSVLGRMSTAEAEQKAGDFTRAALSKNILPLSRNPMLLTTMVLIHQKEVGLPKERARLYDEGVKVLLTRWQQRKDGRLVEDEELAEVLKDEAKLRRILERLAFEAHRVGGTEEEEAAGLPRGEILVLLACDEYLGDAGLADRFLDYVDQRAGILVGQGGELRQPASYSFPHRTFQEYLAGCHVVGQRERERRYFNLTVAGDWWSVAALLGAEELLFVRRGANEVMDLAYALAGECRPSNDQQQRALLWAGQIAALVGIPSFERDQGLPGKEGFLDRLRQGLVGLLGSDLPAPERAEAGRTLGWLGDPREGVIRCDAMEFCWVPAGPFVFGAGKKESKWPRDLSQREAELGDGYWITRYPVTRTQFEEFMAAGGYADEGLWPEAKERGVWTPEGVKGKFDDTPRRASASFGEPFELPNHPVVGLTWYEARAFARWLARRWTEAGLLPEGFEVDLPTEQEWEKAARGGKEVPQAPVIRAPHKGLEAPSPELAPNPLPARVYPWGNEPPDPDRANFEDARVEATSTPGCFSKGASPVGCEEMSGNVWEWCASRLDEEDDSPESPRVLRGGAFPDVLQYVRAAVRYRYDPDFRFRNLGLRLVVRPFSSGL